MSAALMVDDLTVSVGDKQIIKGLDLEVPFGEIHALMGPNGSGKSTLCHVLSGKTGYSVSGSAVLGTEEILGRSVDEISRMGLLQAFQYPTEIRGVHLRDFLGEVADERGIDRDELDRRIDQAAPAFGMEAFLERDLNDELSGGEKKRSEIFQLSVLRPKVSLLDEIDSGLDIDAVRQVAAAVEAMRGPDVGILMITHYARILRYLSPDRVHVMLDGRIVQSGGPELADELERGGYEGVRRRLGIERPRADEKPKASELFTDTPFDI